jgi:PAS domain-containing protein
MTILFPGRFKGPLRSLRSFLGIRRGAAPRPVIPAADDTWDSEEITDIDEVVHTFTTLVAQLCKDGAHLGEICAQAERRAAKYAILSETVVDSVSSGLLVVEDTGEINLANAAAKRILGIDAREDVRGKRIAGLLGDSSDLQALVAETLAGSRNLCRRTLNLRGRDHRPLCLGASTSCVFCRGKVGAVIVVFADLNAARNLDLRTTSGESREAPLSGYLRGVLDCYDHFSAVVREVEKVQAKADKGSLGTSDIADCVAFTRRAWEIMSAFALSLVAGNSLCEITDVEGTVRSVVARRRELSGVRLALPSGDLPRVKTVRKVFDAGLELLLLGCVSDAAGGVAMSADAVRDAGSEAIEIKVTETGPRSPLLAVGETLREFRSDKDLRREAGLMLLRSLSTEDHRTVTTQGDQTLVFRVILNVAAQHGAGPAAQRGDFSEREPGQA